MSPFIICWIRSINFAIPVNRIAEALGLLAEIIDVGLGHFLRSDAGLDGIVLSWKAESIITERTKNIHLLLRIETSETVNDTEVADMADMEAGARWVWEHFGEEHLRPIIVVFGGKRLLFFPALLPFFFDF